jgi:rRNA-processing protein FCF1
MFLAHNAALVPPYRVLIDTNFINFSLQNKLELVSGMMDCLYAKCMLSQLIFHHIQLKFTRPRHTLHHRLRHGGTGKARASLSCSAKVGQARVNRFARTNPLTE